MRAIPNCWRAVLADAVATPSFDRLCAFVDAERAEHTVFPPEGEVFTALELTAYVDVRVLILGQDPYHDEGQAHGLAFSVRPGVPFPPSLSNVFRELGDDVGCARPSSGFLVPWAEQGVLLLNTVLTVRAHEPNSHRGKGWERFTDAVISRLSERDRPLVFVLWGGNAAKKVGLIDASRHTILRSAHPSPLSAHRGFLGSTPFSKIDAALRANGERPIEWCLP